MVSVYWCGDNKCANDVSAVEIISLVFSMDMVYSFPCKMISLARLLDCFGLPQRLTLGSVSG